MGICAHCTVSMEAIKLILYEPPRGMVPSLAWSGGRGSEGGEARIKDGLRDQVWVGL